MRHAWIPVLLVLGLVACRPEVFKPMIDIDPALWADDPSAFKGDDWDRRAAAKVDAVRGTSLLGLVGRPGTDEEVVRTLWETADRSDGTRESMGFRLRAEATDVLLIRRPRAVYALTAEAMAGEDATQRRVGLFAFEFVEGRKRGGPSSADPGPPYEGPERDAAITAAARILISDPDPSLRHQAISMMHTLLPDHDEPSPAELAAALAREEGESRRWLFWLMGERKVPPALLLDGAKQGFTDPVDVSVGIYDIFVAENKTLLEKAFAEGNTACRAGIGETFYRRQDDMPWARDLILRGLADPEHAVRTRFAKGTIVLRPFDDEVRARLEALAPEAYTARWALAINDGREPEPPPDDVHVREAPDEPPR